MNNIRKAARQKSKLRLGLSSVSGGGKTKSALRLAYGFMDSYEKVIVIDSENGSADLYADMGDFSVLPLGAPYPPEKYIAAINECVKAGFELIIIDSITHEWDGVGGCLEIKQMLGDGYDKWKTVTPRHQKFIDAITSCPVHIITTVRRKQDYEMSKGENGGKGKVQKVGLKEVTREGFEYELTANLEIELNHLASASKDRTGLFMDIDPFIISEETGVKLKEWCDSGVAPIERKENKPPAPNTVIPIVPIGTEHDKFESIKDNIVNKGFTFEQVAKKYELSEEAVNDIKAAIKEKQNPVTPKPEPQQITQAMIHEMNSQYATDPF